MKIYQLLPEVYKEKGTVHTDEVGLSSYFPTQNAPDINLVSSDTDIPLRLLQVTQFQRFNTTGVFMFTACPILIYIFLYS